ncbi:MAG: aspartate aminotransferase family protein [Bryobacteraceae bacterium]|nr:aspartate aminotransferase family protein [Bryobacteraceae bacterium]
MGFGAEVREASVRRKAAGSLARWERSKGSLAGGVSSGLRRTARPFPMFYQSGAGAEVTDVDGNHYVDYTLAWGPLILGHAPPEVNEAIRQNLERGHTFGAQHDLEYEVAELIQAHVPCAERVCFANSGTEIVQVALRLARAHTGRQMYLKFEGHYHGWADSVLVSYKPSGEQIREFGYEPIPVGAGQRPNSGAIVVEWNDRAGVEAAFRRHGAEISAVICEPVLCNSGCIPPVPGFLEFLREATLSAGAVLIFDEVITGFRLGIGGGQAYYGVTPDLATFAKAVGGGLPLSMLAGKAALMDHISNGTVVHAGTLNGNPLVLAAAKATLETLAHDDGAVYRKIWKCGERLRDGLSDLLRKKGHAIATNGLGPVFQLSFQDMPPRNYRETLLGDTKLYSDFALALLDEGILVLPDGRWYLSAAHTEEHVDRTLAAVARL